jgi:hypothetical protein
MNRRFYFKSLAAVGLGSRFVFAEQPAEHFFTVEERDGRWWLIAPEGKPFFSIGLNHIDPTPLRSAADADLWQQKYDNSMQRWLEDSVRPDLQAWGFNTIGWTPEVVSRGNANYRHSRLFTFEEYQWLGLPYCHQLPFTDFHQWDVETKNPAIDSPEFADWCDYVAREHCSRMKNDPKLMGYFYLDCPTWIHTRAGNQWRGPMFDPGKLKSTEGRQELRALASKYYRITHDAIRRYDRHHLILGDRYDAEAPLASEVIEAALPYVDILSFQDFSKTDKVLANLSRWHSQTGKPVLLADYASRIRHSDGSQSHDGETYAKTLSAVHALPGCVGLHLCGAYLQNSVRRRGLRIDDRTFDSGLEAISKANRDIK